jgi:pimeloyl-ACP methyl ester carboxylesterase
MSIYQRGDVRIHYEEAGSGFPLLVIPGGGLNSTIAGLASQTHPFNPFDAFKDEFRVIAADLRNAKGGESSGPLETDRPWDAYTDDHIGLMDHLGIRDFLVLGFCIGGPFIWNLLTRASDRVVAAVPAQPSGYPPRDAQPFLRQQHERLGSGTVRPPARHHDGDGRHLPDQYVPCPRRLRLHRDARFRARLPDADPGVAGRRAGASICRRHGNRASRAERASEPLPVEGHPG